jgi:16S rRNA processing protein RimM
MKEWVLVGSIGKPHGIKGWLKINSYTEPLNNIFLYQPWHLDSGVSGDKSLFPVEIKHHQIQNHRLIVQFADYQTTELARTLTNYKIYVARQTLPELSQQEYYWTDLEGLKVYTCKNVYLGIVQSLFATGANDVLIIEGKKRYLIPFLLDTIIKLIDLKQQVMMVDWDPEF